MTEHEAIVELKAITQVYQGEDPEELETKFYNQLTLNEILDDIKDINCIIGAIKQILREVEYGKR